MKNTLLIFLLIGITSIPAAVHGQKYLIEFSARGAGIVSPLLPEEEDRTHMREFQAAGYSGEAIFYPVNFAGAGVFCSRDIGALAQIDATESRYGLYPSEIYGEASYLMFGLTGKVTTNRQRRFSIYGVGRIFKIEVVDRYEGFSIAQSGSGYSAGFGVNLKFAPWMAFNIFEASYIGLSKDLSYSKDKSSNGVFFQSGFTFQFVKKK